MEVGTAASREWPSSVQPRPILVPAGPIACSRPVMSFSLAKTLSLFNKFFYPSSSPLTSSTALQEVPVLGVGLPHSIFIFTIQFA